MTRFWFLILLCVCGLLAGVGAWSWADEAPSKDKPPPAREILVLPFIDDRRTLAETPAIVWARKVDGVAQSIDAWEQETGIKVPPDYRAFLLAINGGYPWPKQIRIDAVPAEVYSKDHTVDVDRLMDWDYVVKTWNDTFYADILPPNMLYIADDYYNFRLLLSVDKDTYGQVFAWVRANVSWGTKYNNEIYPVAASFNDLLRGFHNPDGEARPKVLNSVLMKPFVRAYQIPE